MTTSTVKPRLISCKDDERSKKQLVVHYDYPYAKKNHSPICNPPGWQDHVWILDPVDGLGADICGRCIKAWDAREEKKRKAKNKRTREYYKKTRDRQIAYSESYRSNGRKSIIKKKRQYYRDNAELIKKKRREYYAENRERLLTAQQAKRQARRTEVTSSPMDSDTRPGHADPSQNPVTPT